MNAFNALHESFKDSGNVWYLERMINGAIRENRNGRLDKYVMLILVPEYGLTIAMEIKKAVQNLDPAVVSITLER